MITVLGDISDDEFDDNFVNEYWEGDVGDGAAPAVSQAPVSPEPVNFAWLRP